MSDTFTVQRDGERDLVFNGTELGHGSSYEIGKTRWFEVTLYRTDGGSYVIEGAGRSEVEGEVNKLWAEVCSDADSLVTALQREEKACRSCRWTGRDSGRCVKCGGTDFIATGVRYLPRTAQVALDEAAYLDEDVADAMSEKVA